jgi:peptidoglycan/LPS O-acetylase OafA/YrhL
MSTSTATITTTQSAPPRTASLPRTAITVGIVAAAATTAIAAVVRAAGVPLDVDGPIPLAAFAQMTLLGAIIGGVLAALFRRRSHDPARRFVRTALALVALSCLPSIALPSDLATKIALVTTHLVAAAIIIPVLARRVSA